MDFKSKQLLIESIAAEVSELHPLLSSVLDKLQNITHVECTHGVFEKGADFVLTRLDPALGTYSHIGVVVKKGKISSDITDISRQIEECTQPRLLQGGKRSERLTEIWVINTSSISINAKEKIFDTYVRQRIEFIDGEQLTRLVDKHAPYFWHAVPSAIGRYLDDVRAQILASDHEAGTVGGIAVDKFYIEPDIQEIDRSSYQKNSARQKKPRLVNLTEEVLTSAVTILEGEMGFGKSKTARVIVQHYCAPDQTKLKNVVPIYASFRKYCESKSTLNAFISRTLGDVESELTGDYKILVVLDGIDEAAIGDAWKTTLSKIFEEAKENGHVRVLLTTRPLKILDEDQELYRGARRFVLRPLSLAKTVLFIRQACKEVAVSAKIYEDLQKSDLFKQLPQSPIAAALLSSLIAQNQNDLPGNLTELYSKSIEYMLGRWDVQKGRALEKEYQAAERVVLEITEYIVGNQLIWMSFEEAKGIVTKWHSLRNTGVEIDALLDRVFVSSGIFIVDDWSGTVSFRHRSFGEYLYARAAKARGKAIPKEHAFDGYWGACTFFYIGLLGDCQDLLTDLYNAIPSDESETWRKILSLPNYSLAGYQTEYAVVENNLFKLFIEAAKLYEKVRTGETFTKLNSLPEMHLLWLFQRVIRGSYDYNFLKPAITQTIISIDESKTTPKEKFVALFFASCFASQLDDSGGFTYILENYPIEQIPVTVALGIQIETKYNAEFYKLPLVKAHEKRLYKLLFPNHRSKPHGTKGIKDSKLSDLFDKPLKSRRLED